MSELQARKPGPLAQEAAQKAETAIYEQFDELSHEGVINGVALGRLLNTSARPLYEAIVELGMNQVTSRSTPVYPAPYLKKSTVRFTQIETLEINQHRYMRTQDLVSVARSLRVPSGVAAQTVSDLGMDAMLPLPRRRNGLYGEKAGYYDLDQIAAIKANLPDLLTQGYKPSNDRLPDVSPDDIPYDKVVQVLGRIGLAEDVLQELFATNRIVDTRTPKVDPQSRARGTYLPKDTVAAVLRFVEEHPDIIADLGGGRSV